MFVTKPLRRSLHGLTFASADGEVWALRNSARSVFKVRGQLNVDTDDMCTWTYDGPELQICY